LAVVATHVGAVELLVDNQNGWVIEKPNTTSIFHTIDLAIKEDKLSIDEKKKKAILKIKKGFVWNTLIKKLIKI
jgi:glycosyltransferase involved in cell wall biosynthesis